MKRAFLAKVAVLFATVLSALPAVAKPISAEPQRVVYQVYVRGFFDSPASSDGDGDFAGLAAKLDYFGDLGVDTLMLMPVFSNTGGMGYIPTDYYTLDRAYGSEAELGALLKAAHSRNIKIIFDAPINHISDSSMWFQQAMQKDCEGGSNFQNKYCGYFYFSKDPCVEAPFLNWHKPWNWERTTCRDVWFSPWGFDPQRHRSEKYYATFFNAMPDLSFWDYKKATWNNAVVNDVQGALDKWTRLGVDAFRIDAAKHFVENEKTNNKPHDPRNLALLRNFLTSSRRINPDVSFIAEAWDGYDVIDEFAKKSTDLVLDFPFLEALRASLKSDDMGRLYGSLKHIEATQDSVALAQRVTFAGNHDVSRLFTEFKGDIERMKQAHFLTLTGPGIPLLFYGEELGMEGKVKRPDPKDPNDKEEYVRTVYAFPWNGSESLGFPSGRKPNAGAPANYREFNLEKAKSDSKSLWNDVRTILKIRKGFPISTGTRLQVLETYQNTSLAYALVNDDGSCLVSMLNLSKHDAVTVNWRGQLPRCGAAANLVYSNNGQDAGGETVLSPNGKAIFITLRH